MIVVVRYTTCIDLSDYPMLYRNLNVRLLYFHLCLISGYHDDDRDIVDVSLRRLADGCGITLSAVRHGLRVLGAAGLVRFEGSLIFVMKWVSPSPISKRSSKIKDEKVIAEAENRRRRDESRMKQIDDDRRRRAELEDKGLSSFIVFYESKIDAYRHGDDDALSSLRRHAGMYHSECLRLNHTEIKIDL